MIYKADASVINFLLTARASYNQEELHESSRKIGHYILIDYFDWLDYMNRIDNESLITKTLYEFRTIYMECKDIVEILKNKLTSDNISNILRSNKKLTSGNVEKTKIEFLCQGYQLFVEEIFSLQVYLLNVFRYNNNAMPMLLVPFSAGLNRLSSGHLNLKEEVRDDGLMYVRPELGKIVDKCQRSSVDFGIRTYTFHKICEQRPYNLPSDWQISKHYTGKERSSIHEKMLYVVDCYSQFCYTGFASSELKTLFTNPEMQDSTIVKGNDLYSNIFLLNFPFLLQNMSLTPDIVDGENLNQVQFKKMV